MGRKFTKNQKFLSAVKDYCSQHGVDAAARYFGISRATVYRYRSSGWTVAGYKLLMHQIKERENYLRNRKRTFIGSAAYAGSLKDEVKRAKGKGIIIFHTTLPSKGSFAKDIVSSFFLAVLIVLASLTVGQLIWLTFFS